jgi:hypothetical protein
MTKSDFSKEFYIEPNFAWLAGPYDTTIKSHQRMLRRVLNDMINGNIEHRVVEDNMGRSMVERRGMILSKR